MRAEKNHYFINDTIEIRILLSEWCRIKTAAELNQVTFSWIVRLCTFRLMATSLSRREFIPLRKKSKMNYIFPQEPLHRHMLCLYGDDALCLRLAASKYGLTMTAFVRMALMLFLEDYCRLCSEKEMIHRGVKMIKSAQLPEFPISTASDTDFHIRTVLLRQYIAGEIRRFTPWRRKPERLPNP